MNTMITVRRLGLASVLAVSLVAGAQAATPAPEGASVYFVTPMDQPIPADANHIHFGGGQTQTTLELPPGEHTLQLLMGDHLHVPHEPPVMSDKITIMVE